MSNRPLPPPAAEPAQAARSRVAIVVAAVVGFALVAAIASVLAARSSSKGASSATTAGAAVAGPGAPAELQPVQVSGASLPSMPKSGNDAAVGTKAPALAGASFDGTPVSITPGSSPMVVLFVAHWCPHCQREVPLIVKYLAAGKLPPGMKMVAVATGTSKDAPNYPPSAWLKKEGFTPPVLADDAERGTAAAAYGLPGYPYFVVLKADGTVAARSSGEKTEAELDALFATALQPAS